MYYWRAEGAGAPLTSAQSEALFGNVDAIYQFNRRFLEELQVRAHIAVRHFVCLFVYLCFFWWLLLRQACDLDPVHVARCFVRNNCGFTIYTDYCTNYPRYTIYRVLLGFTGFNWVLLGYNWLITGFQLVLPGYNWFYQVLHSSTQFYLV